MAETACEMIGKVKLDYSKYPGEDLYCDGEVEDELLQVARDLSPVEYARVIEERASWPVLYHLSPLRENIVEWIPMEKGAKTLEVGSGCGAVTGVLARKSASVTCVELSKKRSKINAYRHSECGNVTIQVGNFQDIEPGLPRDFDYIFLIGVFEYGKAYIGGKTPYTDFLKKLLSHLAPGGRIVIAIENKYGMKYFAGCMEDHLGAYFSGIENYRDGGNVRTFSRKGLERIFQDCGVEEYHFYYPYPDYKFMTSLYSDAYQPGKGELSNNLRNFDRDRLLLFSEKDAFDGVVDDGLFPIFANSYLAVIGADFAARYVKYSNDRAPEYAIRTEIGRGEGGKAYVRKYPLNEAAREHVRGMAAAYENLRERYQGGRLEINKCQLGGGAEGVYAEFEFVEGVPLSACLDRCLEEDDQESFLQYFREYLERIRYNSACEVTDFDLVFSNILVQGDRWTLIDYEWTFGKKVEARELAFRAVYCYLLEDEKRNKLNLDAILRELDITETEAEQFRRQEMDFQKYVTGNRLSMAEIRNLTGGEILEPLKWVHRFQSTEAVLRVQIYEDTGEGFSEERSRFLEGAYLDERRVEFEIAVGRDVKRLRVDPALCPCVCRLREMAFNGEPIALDNRKAVSLNGKILKSGAGGGQSRSVVFPTSDPGICLDLEGFKAGEENRLSIRMEVVRLTQEMAEDMAGAVRRII